MWQRKNLFVYRDRVGDNVHCQIMMTHDNVQKTVVVATELECNPGPSITMSTSALAAAVCSQFQIAPERLVLIENYIANFRGKMHPQIFEMVIFEQSQVNAELFSAPRWQHMTEYEWSHLGVTKPV